MPSFLKNPLPWIVVLVLVLFLILTGETGHVFLLPVFLTSLALIFSNGVFKFSKAKTVVLVETPMENDVISSANEFSPPMEKEVEVENGVLTPEIDQNRRIQAQPSVGSPDLYSETETVDRCSSTSEDSDIEWPFSGNAGPTTTDCSEDSISDEESLIEIALPGGHFVGTNEEESEPKLRKAAADDFPKDSIFKQQSLIELLAEINEGNEEDNLIEIDILMGSIKCPRFEIEA